MNTQLVKIFMPILPDNISSCYLKGYIRLLNPNSFTIFIIAYSKNKRNLIDKNLKDDSIIYGCCSNIPCKKKLNSTNYVGIDKNGYLYTMIINGVDMMRTINCIILLYDYNKVRNSETINSQDGCFSILQDLIQRDIKDLHENSVPDPILQIPSWLASTMFGQHIYNYINLSYWLYNVLKKKEKVSIKQGNLIFAVFVDILLGYVILQLLIREKDLGVLLMSILEKLVNLMYSLLKWLMGAPAGLKLNNAFNNMLGKYFLYHIELWWLFLDISGEKLNVILKIYQYIGYLGLTFQAAIISDMICIATFHSYCIYVYAARLFNIQISGLKALFRLFVGRKHNPLRGGIDSCEYTNQELFVGTVAFMILLLLLPTTVMYYIVFTMFRILSLLVQYILSKLIYTIQTLPLYAAILWFTKSPKIAGNVHTEEVNCRNDSRTLILRVNLINKMFQELMISYRPPVKMLKHVEWKMVISNVFTGNQII